MPRFPFTIHFNYGGRDPVVILNRSALIRFLQTTGRSYGWSAEASPEEISDYLDRVVGCTLVRGVP